MITSTKITQMTTPTDSTNVGCNWCRAAQREGVTSYKCHHCGTVWCVLSHGRTDEPPTFFQEKKRRRKRGGGAYDTLGRRR